jgi:hypothetical protein
MNLCDLSGGQVCPRCGREALAGTQYRHCTGPGYVMVGDVVAAGLASVGITKAAVSALVGGDCGCTARQNWMNQAGVKVQQYARKAIKAAGHFYGIE